MPPGAILGGVPEPCKGQPSDHSDKLFESVTLRPNAGDDAAALAKALATGGFGVVRAKGYLRGPDGEFWLVQTVGPRWEAMPTTGTHEIGIVCLGFRGALDAQAIESAVVQTNKFNTSP